MTGVSREAGQELTRITTRARHDGDLPSLAAATFAAGEIVWQAAGAQPGCQYRIGSITKAFTAVEVMRLRDDGRLCLDDPIGAHLADTPYPDHTVRRLLAHSSGMTAEPAGPWWERSAGRTWPELVAANIDPQRDVYGPGERFHYSNLGYGLLGELVARLRHQSWFESVRTSMLRPLGLAQTTYGPMAGAAVGTSRHPRSRQLVGEPAVDTMAMAAAGQLWSTPADLARWADFLVTGRDGVLPASTLLEMRTAQSADPDTQHRGAYGLGLRLDWTASGTLVGHTGSMPGFVSGLFVDPASRVGAVMLANATAWHGPDGMFARLIETTASGLPEAPPTPAAVPLATAGELAGSWHWGNTAMSLQATSDGLAITQGDEERRFVVDGRDRYRGVNGYFAGEQLTVVRRDDGSISHLEVVTFILTRKPYDERAPIPGGQPTELSLPG